MGYELGEIVGRPHSMFVERDYAESRDYGDFWNDLASGRHKSSEFRRVTKTGQIVVISGSCNPIFATRRAKSPRS